VALIVSCLALIVSVAVLWLTFFRRSTVVITQPTIIALGYTEPPHVLPNISLNTLLLAKPERWPTTRVVGGCVIESMYLKLSLGETVQNFLVWYHGDERSGLFVGETGVSERHRFFTAHAGRGFRFTEGTYKLEIFGCLVGHDSKPLLDPIMLTVSREMAQQMSAKLHAEAKASIPRGIRWDFGWEPELETYLPPVMEEEPLPFRCAPDYGPPEITAGPDGAANPNWMLYQNQREHRSRQRG
jgi:hypothetical protein